MENAGLVVETLPAYGSVQVAPLPADAGVKATASPQRKNRNAYPVTHLDLTVF